MVDSAPPRGTRPRNRQSITLSAASELFHRRGYRNVSMGDIAAATNVGASAIYRHFPSKADLLIAAILSGLNAFNDEVRSAPADLPLADVFHRLAFVALDHRALGVLWQREARNLSESQRVPLRDGLREMSGLLRPRLVSFRPGLSADQVNLLAWCVMGAMVSISFHSTQLPRERFAQLLADICMDIVGASLPSGPFAASPLSVAAPDSRREALLEEATELFAERGFGGAGIDEIADAAGIAGPALYRHFASKQELLVAIVERGHEYLQTETQSVLDRGLPPAETLNGLVDSYLESITRKRFAMRVIISEMSALPDGEREASRQLQRKYIGVWVDLLRQVTGLDDEAARIRVEAILLVANDAVQTPHLREQPGFEELIGAVARRMLGRTS